MRTCVCECECAFWGALKNDDDFERVHCLRGFWGVWVDLERRVTMSRATMS